MTDDKLLNDLARHAREHRTKELLSDAWDDYAHGKLDTHELDSLMQEMNKEQGTEAEEAFRPLDHRFIADVIDSVAPESPDVRRRRGWPIPLALAATLLLSIGVFTNLSVWFAPTSIPQYSANMLGGSQYRSGSPGEEEKVYARGDRIEVRLTPATAIEREVSAQIFVIRDDVPDDRYVPLTEATWLISASGAAKIVLEVGTSFPDAPGQYNLVAIIGRSNEFPSADVLGDALSDQFTLKNPGWQAWKFKAHVQAD